MKRGISLIVLIITIIVMIIIAAAVIISISETGIIGKTSQAVDDTNKNTIEEAANLALGELILNNVEDIDTTKIINKMEENGIKDKDLNKYNITYDVDTGRVSVSAKASVPGTAVNIFPITIDVGENTILTWTNESNESDGGKFTVTGSGATMDFEEPDEVDLWRMFRTVIL